MPEPPGQAQPSTGCYLDDVRQWQAFGWSTDGGETQGHQQGHNEGDDVHEDIRS